MAAGDLPPHVVSGQPIQSSWGNAVVDELARSRAETWLLADHAGVSGVSGGEYDLGVTNIGPFSYQVRVSAIATFNFGFSSGFVNAVPSLIRILDGGARIIPGIIQVPVATTWMNTTIPWAWTVAAGQNGGFKTHINFAQIQSGGAFASANVLYVVERFAA